MERLEKRKRFAVNRPQGPAFKRQRFDPFGYGSRQGGNTGRQYQENKDKRKPFSSLMDEGRPRRKTMITIAPRVFTTMLALVTEYIRREIGLYTCPYLAWVSESTGKVRTSSILVYSSHRSKTHDDFGDSVCSK